MALGEIVPASRGDAAPAAAATAIVPWTPARCGPVGEADAPFDDRQLRELDEVIDAAERVTGLRFSVYLGDLGQPTRATALRLLAGLGIDAPYSVLVAVSPGQRTVEVVTGTAAARRVSDRGARLAVLSAIASAGEGDLFGALTNAVRTLADQAGTLPQRSSW